MLPSYRNQSVDLFCKSTDWFLYDRNIGPERFNQNFPKTCDPLCKVDLDAELIIFLILDCHDFIS